VMPVRVCPDTPSFWNRWNILSPMTRTTDNWHESCRNRQEPAEQLATYTSDNNKF
jgi:hypothetical protein